MLIRCRAQRCKNIIGLTQTFIRVTFDWLLEEVNLSERKLNSRYIGDAFNLREEMTSIYLQFIYKFKFLLKFPLRHYDNFPMILCQFSLYLHSSLSIAYTSV